MKEYKVGLLGLGSIGRVHAYALGALPHYYDLPFKVILGGVYNRTYEKALAAVKKLGFEYAARTPEELILRSDIDAICICLPNHQHEEYAIKALEAGKHLYCEKPLCLTHERAQRIGEAAKKAGVKAQIVFHNRFFPAVMRAKQLMEEGRIGRLYSFEAKYYHSTNIDADKPFNWRFSKDIAGGGTLFDMGSHVIDIVSYLGGRYARVNAAMQTAIKSRFDGGVQRRVDVDDAVYITAELQNGAFGTIIASKLATGTNDELEIRFFGDKGAMRFSTESPNHLEFYDNADKGGSYGGDKGVKLIESYQRFDPPGGTMPSPKSSVGWVRAHVHSMYTFFESVHTGKNCDPSIEDGIYNQYVLEKVSESAEDGIWKTL